LSQATLTATVLGTGVQGQVQVLDIAPYPDNDWGDDYVIVRATIAEYQFAGAAGTAI